MRKIFLMIVAFISLSFAARAEFVFECKPKEGPCVASFAKKMTAHNENAADLCNVSEATAKCKTLSSGWETCKVRDSACSKLAEVEYDAPPSCGKNTQAQVIMVKTVEQRFEPGKTKTTPDLKAEPGFCIVRAPSAPSSSANHPAGASAN